MAACLSIGGGRERASDGRGLLLPPPSDGSERWLVRGAVDAITSTDEKVRLLKQAACLYEVQSFCSEKEWPPTLLKKLFYNLYENDVIFEDAFTHWREGDPDVAGKTKALVEVNEFSRPTSWAYDLEQVRACLPALQPLHAR